MVTYPYICLCCNTAFVFSDYTGVGMSMVRSASSAILPHHYDKKSLNFSLAIAMMGLCIGLIFYPIVASYLFATHGFNHAMLILSPLMLLHYIGVSCYSQEGDSRSAIIETEEKTLLRSLKDIVTDATVRNLQAGF